MTSRELFIKTFKGETARFEKVLKAVNQKKWSYKPDAISRTGQQLLGVFSEEFAMMVDIAAKGSVTMGKPAKPATLSLHRSIFRAMQATDGARVAGSCRASLL